MPIMLILEEAVKGSLNNMLQIAMIVIPLMIFIELFKDLNLLDRLTSILSPLTSFIGISREGNLPLLAGLIFGIGYGGGIIIDSARQGKLSMRDIYIVNLFLVICHSVLEDTLLFAAIGAKWAAVLIIRILLAVLVCFLWAHFIPVSIEAKNNNKIEKVMN